MNKKTPDYNEAMASLDSECIYFDGRMNVSGYGILSNGKPAHIDLWEKTHGPIPEGMKIVWTCGVKSCQNLDHMYLSKDGHFKFKADYVEVGRGRTRRVVVAHETKTFVKGTKALKKVRQLPFTKEYLQTMFDYDEGRLKWRESARGRTKGKAIGTVDTKIPIIGCSVDKIRCGLHELVWVYFNGPIEEDQRIIFKDGDALNCDIDNLTLVDL